MRPGDSGGRRALSGTGAILLEAFRPATLENFEQNRGHMLAVMRHRTIAGTMNGGSVRSRLERNHLPVRLRRAAAHPPRNDGLSAVDIEIDNERRWLAFGGRA